MSEKRRTALAGNDPAEPRTAKDQIPVSGNNPAGARTAKDKVPVAGKDSAAAGRGEERLMYVGPTITGFAIQNRVYSRIPDEAKERFKTSPWLRNLFIPVAEYPKANKSLRTRTGYIYEAYMKAGEVRNG